MKYVKSLFFFVFFYFNLHRIKKILDKNIHVLYLCKKKKVMSAGEETAAYRCIFMQLKLPDTQLYLQIYIAFTQASSLTRTILRMSYCDHFLLCLLSVRPLIL